MGGLCGTRQDGHVEIRSRLAHSGSVYGINDSDSDGVNGFHDGDDFVMVMVAPKGGRSSCNTRRPKSQPRPG